MSGVLRSTTFQLEFNGQDGVTGIKQFTRAVSDADKVVDELSAALGNNVTVSYKNVRSSQELTAEARALVAQMERTNSAVKSLTEQYNHQAAMIGKTAQEQEVLNAVHRLGANATAEQRQQITQLVQNYQRLRDGANGTQGSFRNLRGVSQQLGWQLQDVAVQAQMGTNAFVILSQQGSQLAAAFGPTGALVGAFIAVASALAMQLVPSLKDSSKEIDSLINKIDKLGKAQKAQLNIQLTDQLAKQKEELAALNYRMNMHSGLVATNTNQSKERIEALRRETVELESQKESLTSAITETQKRIDLVNRSYRENVNATDEAAEATKELLNQYGIEFNQLKMNDRQIAIDNALRKLGTSVKKKDRDAVLLAIKTYYDEKDALKESEKALKANTKAAKSAIADAARLAKQKESAFNAETLSLVKQTETIEEEYRRRKAVIDDYVKHTGSDKRTDEAYAALEQWRTQELVKETDKRIAEYQRREDARKQIEQGQDKTLGVRGEIKRESSAFAANMRLLSDQHTQVEQETQRHLQSIKQARDNGKLTKDQYDIAVAQANNEGLSEQQRINQLKEAEEERHTQSMQLLQLQLYKSNLQTLSLASTAVTDTIDLMSDGVEQVKSKTAEMNAFQKAMFIMNQSIAAAMAFIDGISLGMELAKMFPMAYPAMIAIGTSIGAAQSGAIMGATFAGTFDNGGYIPPGQNGIVSEYGDELVNGVLVKGPARVTSREDTAAAMSGGASSVKILIENKIDGATYTTQQIDENTVKVIAEKVFNQNIDSGVSNVLGNRNSKSTKQLKSNFNVRGKY